MNYDSQVCSVCGAEIRLCSSRPILYCYRHDPQRPWVTSTTLESLRAVPKGFRVLVERGELHEMVKCGDFDYLHANRLEASEFEALAEHPSLQPFAKAGDGALWCWRTDSSEGADSAVWHVEIWGELKEYSPSFETFLYRGALEEASGRWAVESDELVDRLDKLAGTMSVLGREDLALDLRRISVMPFRDLRSDEYRRLGLECNGVISKTEARERISRYLGDKYLCDHIESV